MRAFMGLASEADMSFDSARGTVTWRVHCCSKIGLRATAYPYHSVARAGPQEWSMAGISRTEMRAFFPSDSCFIGKSQGRAVCGPGWSIRIASKSTF